MLIDLIQGLQFIIKIMNNNPRVSEFIIYDKFNGPKMHQLLRSKVQEPMDHFITSQSKSIRNQPQQFIVKVQNKSLRGNNELTYDKPASGVRGQIDVCLDAIESIYKKEKRNKTIKTDHLKSVRDEQIISNTGIHRIDTDIVKQYVSAVFKDYKLRNRFSDSQVIQPHRRDARITSQQTQKKQRAELERNNLTEHRRTSSVGGKKFLNITQISKISRNSLSSKKHVIEPIPNNANCRTYSYKDSPTLNTRNVWRQPQTSIKSSRIEKIPEDFKYCINCQRSILSANINYHQLYQCRNFAELYKMGFKQLTVMVHQKIERIRRELRQSLEKNKSARFDNGWSDIVDKMENYVKEFGENEVNLEGINHQKYAQFEARLQNPLNQAIDLTKKLQWFTSIHNKLIRQSNDPHRVGNIETLKFIQTSITPKQLQLSRVHQNTPINILRFHPHLHQRSN